MEVLKVTAKLYSLNFQQLENLLLEFYGRLLDIAQEDKSELESGEFDFGFENEDFDSKELIKEAEIALTCFKIKKGK